MKARLAEAHRAKADGPYVNSGPPKGGHYVRRTLLLGRVFRRSSSRRPQEQPLAIAQDHVRAVGSVGAVLRAVSLDSDLRARLPRFLGEATSHHRVRRAAFDHPPRDGAVWVLDVEMNPRVRIDPIHLDDGAFERHRLGGVELGGGPMMRSQRRGHTEGRDQSDQYDSCFIHSSLVPIHACGQRSCLSSSGAGRLGAGWPPLAAAFSVSPATSRMLNMLRFAS